MSIGDELFELVQADQGRAFIADSLDDMPADGVLRIARGALKHTERTARLLRKFIKQHEEDEDNG